MDLNSVAFIQSLCNSSGIYGRESVRESLMMTNSSQIEQHNDRIMVLYGLSKYAHKK